MYRLTTTITKHIHFGSLVATALLYVCIQTIQRIGDIQSTSGFSEFETFLQKDPNQMAFRHGEPHTSWYIGWMPHILHSCKIDNHTNSYNMH